MKTSAILFFLGLHALPALAQELAPSPTESVGCEPHGNHWHCEGPRPPSTSEAPTQPPPLITTTTAAEPTTTAAQDDDEHTDALAPSPTESIGCEPHGDHWHCEGPREPAETSSEASGSESIGSLTTVTTTTTSGDASGTGALTSTTSGAVVTAGAADGPMVGAAPVFGLVVFAALRL